MPDFDVQQVVEAAAKAAYEAEVHWLPSLFGGTAEVHWEDVSDDERQRWCNEQGVAMSVIVPAVTDQIRALHRRVHLVFTWNSGLHAEDPCPECDGKAGEWPCGCWGDFDIEYHCLECSDLDGTYRVRYPCPTRALCDELDAAVRADS